MSKIQEFLKKVTDLYGSDLVEIVHDVEDAKVNIIYCDMADIDENHKRNLEYLKLVEDFQLTNPEITFYNQYSGVSAVFDSDGNKLEGSKQSVSEFEYVVRNYSEQDNDFYKEFQDFVNDCFGIHPHSVWLEHFAVSKLQTRDVVDVEDGFHNGSNIPVPSYVYKFSDVVVDIDMLKTTIAEDIQNDLKPGEQVYIFYRKPIRLMDDNCLLGYFVNIWFYIAPSVDSRIHLKKYLGEPLIDPIINRMYNWKSRSAYEYIKKLDDNEMYDQTTLSLFLLKEMAIKFEDCGWQDGTVFNELRHTNNRIAAMLGYEWDEKADYWLPV